MRNQLRDIEHQESQLSDDMLHEIVENNWIDKGVPGTNFCTRRLPSHAFMDRNIGHVSDLDTCCMGLWSCDTRVSDTGNSHLPLHWNNNKINSRHWPLWHCQCLQEFHQCLSTSTSDDAERLQNVFKNFGNNCYVLKDDYEK